MARAFVLERTLEEELRARVESIGFQLCGFARVTEPTPRADIFHTWLLNAHHGPLGYLRKDEGVRANARTRHAWANSVISVASFYDGSEQGTPGEHLAAHTARYARGRDYHHIFKRRLKEFGRGIVRDKLARRASCYVDTGPVLERAWAERAGVGWVGKNACLIHPRLGSFMLLGELFVDVELGPGEPLPNHCGTCTRCLDACPTQALVAPGVLDAARCLTTYSIELRGEMPRELWEISGANAVGCDICQTVCPFNDPKRIPQPDAELARPLPWQAMTIADAIVLDNAAFLRLFPASALRRTTYVGVRLGAITVAGNLKLENCRAALEQARTDSNSAIRARAEWALGKL
jgi:epoxyqueuosine reductase